MAERVSDGSLHILDSSDETHLEKLTIVVFELPDGVSVEVQLKFERYETCY